MQEYAVLISVIAHICYKAFASQLKHRRWCNTQKRKRYERASDGRVDYERTSVIPGPILFLVDRELVNIGRLLYTAKAWAGEARPCWQKAAQLPPYIP